VTMSILQLSPIANMQKKAARFYPARAYCLEQKKRTVQKPSARVRMLGQ